MSKHLTASFLLLFFIEVSGQTNNLTVQVFDYNAGFNSYNIKSVAQDKYGFIWAGTQDGIFFFNGKSFKKLINKLEYNQAKDVKKILYDSLRNEMWVAYSTNGIEVFNCNTHEISKRILLRNQSDSSIFQVIKNVNFCDDTIYISTDDGLFILPAENIKTNAILRNPTYNNVEIKDIFHFGNSNYGVINAKGISKISGNEFSTTLFSFSYKTISSVTINNFVYLASDNNVCIYDLATRKSVSIKTEFITNKIVKWNNSILCATDKGLYLLKDTYEFSKINIANNLAESLSDFAITAFADKDDNLWVGFSKCLACINPKPASFIGYSKSNPKYAKLNHIYFTIPINSNEIVLGDLDGLLLFTKNTNQILTLDTTKITYCLARIDSNILLYSNQRGVFAMNCKNKKITAIRDMFKEWRNFGRSVVRCIEKINNDSFLLFQPIEAKLLIWDLKQKYLKEIYLGDNNRFSNNTIYALRKISDSIIIICCEKSIYIYNYLTGNYLEKRYLHPISNEQLNFYFDAIVINNNVWIASYGYGVILLDKKYEISKIVDINNGLSDNGVYRLLRDVLGNVWVSTNNGINKIEPVLTRVNSYYSGDGLHGNMFEQYSGTEYGDELFFAGIDGFTNIIPKNIKSNKKEPGVYITQVAFHSKSGIRKFTDIDRNKIIIETDVDQITITLASTSFESVYKNDFFYKIDRINNDWVSLGNKNEINLLGLPPGSYKLFIKTSNSSGVSNPEDKIIILQVLPKWYQTWWFYLLIALTFMAIVYGLYRIRINQLKKEQRIRTKLASDLHDDLGSTMNSVKVYANLAIMEKQADKYLPMIKEGSQEAITGIRDIIWVLDDSKDSMEQLLSRIGLFASPLCEANHIQYKQELSDHARDHKLKQEERRNLYMMLKEAVNNAIKYSHAQTISINVSVKKGSPVIQIKDDGKGFDTDKTTEGNGLKNMRRRAREIKYHFRIESSPGNGTTLHFEKI